MAGKFIVIDGSDGSGKGTQTDLIIERLKKEGKEVQKCDFPQYDNFFGELIGRYLNNEFGNATKVNPYLVSMLYAADRWKAKEQIKKWLSEDKIVVANRYMSSNLAHQGCKIKDKIKRDEFIKWLHELEFSQFGIPKPDKVIILFVPSKIAQILVDKKDQRNYTEKKRDGHESNQDYLEDTEKLYLELAEKEKWKVIECVKNNELLTKKQINDLILEEI